MKVFLPEFVQSNVREQSRIGIDYCKFFYLYLS
jgi:hypothetical protein